MKKYLIFMLLLLVSVGARAVDVTTIQLAFDTRTQTKTGSDWYYRPVNDVSQIQQGDFIVVSFDKVTSTTKGDCQIAICDKDGTKIYTDGADPEWKCYDCSYGATDFTFPIDADLYKTIVTDGKGLHILDKGLSGNMSIEIRRVSGNWDQYKPTDDYTQIMSIPQYIKDWYEEGYVLKTSTDYVGKTLRVVCLETGDDSYAFLKKNTSGWPSLMSGSDKFSIAGWKYFEIKINDELNTLLKGDGLRIGGNNYYIAGIYVYGTDTTAPKWEDEENDVIDTYTFSSPLDGTTQWDGAKIPGNFFEFQGQDDQISTTKLANTKNNIIRFVFDGTAGEGAQVSAKDANPSSTSSSDDVLKDANDNYAAYIRQRNYDTTNGSFYYVDYADCKQGASHFDFELSDAITLFKDYNHPVVDNTDNAPGTKKGMLSTLLQNGMVIGASKVKVTAVQIRKSMVSKYVTGYAVYKHNLSNTVWRPIAFPYNLTQNQVRTAFGEGTKICELGPSKVTKEVKETGKVSNYYSISLNFKEVTGDINADYPYIIKVGNVHSDNLYKIEGVKADVRDFQAYEFRTGRFNTDDLNATEPEEGSVDYKKNKDIYDFEQKIKGKLTDDVYMVFQSTAPVFNITNTSVGNVEIINGVNSRTTLATPGSNLSYYNYYFYDGVLWPVLETERNLASGLAYIKFPAATKNLFDDAETETEDQASSKLVCLFPDDNSTTGIDNMVAPVKKQMPVAIYNLAGQLVRKGASMEGLAKGIYVINGKKMIIK